MRATDKRRLLDGVRLLPGEPGFALWALLHQRQFQLDLDLILALGRGGAISPGSPIFDG